MSGEAGMPGEAGMSGQTDQSQMADLLFGLVERGDIDALRRLYHPDARIWHNYDQREQTVDQNLVTLAWMCQRLFDRTYEVIRREVLHDGFMQQHVLHGLTRAGEPFAMPACMIVRCAEGRITRIDEYLDPGQAAALSR
jgi:ketosteroid isomerase-like protein